MATTGPAVRAAEIDLREVGKRYGALWAVRDVSLTVVPGEFFTLLGPSGCGKTTVLRMIAGFLEPDAGEIRLDGRSVAGLPPWKRDLGLVFQNYALWPHLNVFEHVAFGLRERRTPRAELRERVEDALRMVGLEALAARRPAQLSGGQQQRVALARTLVLRPRALLLDEPLSNLDARLRAQMRTELRRLHRQLGITTVYVTHDQEEAMALSTRLAVLDHGAVVQVGSPAEIYRRPRTRFVADFLGAANLLEGMIDGPGRVRLSGNLILPVGPATPGRGAVVCLIRPEAVGMGAAGDGGPGRLPATVVGAVYLGGRYDCDLSLPGGERLRAEVPAGAGRAAPRPGEEVTVAIDPDDVVILANEEAER
jgi:ABC-type Fe3+/spermidine/putrescine transport system ATPase subunit